MSRRPRQVPWGDMSRISDPRAREPWEILADVHLRSADYDRPTGCTTRSDAALVGLTPTWDARIVHYDPRSGPCPACGDASIRPGAVCLVCHATDAEAVRWPMQPTPPLRRRARRRRSQSATGPKIIRDAQPQCAA